MPFPYEVLAPYACIMGFFIGAGKLTEWTQREFQNDGYYRRSNNLDDFELELVKRDYRLTGVFRRQSIEPKAAPEFATSSRWDAKTDRGLFGQSSGLLHAYRGY